jgi:hypothetical protein
MKRTGIVLVLLTLAAPGCFGLPVLPDQPPTKATVAEKKDVPPQPPVRADDIDEKNVREKFAALQAEVDRDLSDGPADEKPIKVRP